jgi:hypothetical protein
MGRIKKDHLTPKPKWTFLFHDYSVLAISLSALIIGSISFGIFLNTVLTNDWDIYQQAGRGFWEHVWKSLPMLWLIFIIICIPYSYYAFSETEKGYHYKQSMIISLSILISLILGTLMYITGFAEDTDDYLMETIPYYHYITGNHTCLWLHPEKGLLAGMIISSTTNPVIIVDFEGNQWVTTGVPAVAKDVRSRIGEKIKIIGHMVGNAVFEASEFRHWDGSVEPNPCR